MRPIPPCPDHEDPTQPCRFAAVCEPKIQHNQQLLRHTGRLCWEWRRKTAQAFYDPPVETQG